MDWGLGQYEYIAAQLLPAAEVVVDHLAPRPEEHVVDLGCGSGNAALLIAGRGARVTGVDPSPRLLAVASTASDAQGLNAEFVSGDAGELPVPDASCDALVSVFGVIFAPDAAAAVEEMARVVTPSGRIAFSAWLPGGAISDQAKLRREAVASALGETPENAPFAWHDVAALTALFQPLGFALRGHQEVLAFTANSPQDFVEGELKNHPLWIEAREVLEPTGRWSSVRDATLRIFEEANEEQSAFRVSSRYVVVVATRDDSTSTAP